MSNENLAENQPYETSLLTQVHLFESLDDTITDFHPKVVGRKSSAPEISTGKRVSFHHDRMTNESRRENIPTNRGDAQLKHSRTKSRYSKNGHKIVIRQTRAGSINQGESRAAGMSTKDMKNRTKLTDESRREDRSNWCFHHSPQFVRGRFQLVQLRRQSGTSDMHAQLDTNSQAVLSVISHLEHSLDEQRKQTLQLQAEMAILREQQTKRETELRSSYDAELLRLQGMITRLHSTRSSTDQTTHQISPSRPSSNPSPRLPTAETVTHQPRSTSNTGETNNEIVQLQREIERQDELIAGYQRENERLYAEAKQCKKAEPATKCPEEPRKSQFVDKMYLILTSFLLPPFVFASAAHTHTTRPQIHQLTGKHRQLTEQLECERNENRVEREKLQESHREVVGELQRKLQWYLENQSMVNRDQARLKAQVSILTICTTGLRDAFPSHFNALAACDPVGLISEVHFAN
ncbi:hypothetical protein FGIG_11402 [Fasciola gigantica]|uniref:Centrosomal protein of 162 kDa n=1 Tax=Fasciola gigantica TaxID=46835 RepID=A0A504YDV4_FASGI|nr:hypothetical protein FGIG_11402 [Fasciola gigantica]